MWDLTIGIIKKTFFYLFPCPKQGSVKKVQKSCMMDFRDMYYIPSTSNLILESKNSVSPWRISLVKRRPRTFGALKWYYLLLVELKSLSYKIF